MNDTTLTLGTSTTLDLLKVDEDTKSSLLTTTTTSLTSAHPINNYHYHYYYANSYIESLSEDQLATADELLKQKELELEKPKQLVITKQS
ncbi:MAG: hypothetical protein Q4E69_02100 [Bacilli bacterium]|nr:hypothetical protein [Bacilli bacterium]